MLSQLFRGCASRPFLKRSIVALVGLYLLTLVILLAAEDQLAFAGWTFPKPWQGTPPQTVVEEVTLPAGDGNTIHAWWLPPPGWTPRDGAVLYIHGNVENLSTCAASLLRWRKELKMAVFAFDYPGFGHSTGRPNEQRCYAAGQASLDWLSREKQVALADVILVGQSIGSAIAIELASRAPCRMLITSGAFTSFPDIAQHRYFWLPARYLVRQQFDNAAKIGKVQIPTFIAHGTADHVVPSSHGERLYAAARPPKRFYPIPGHRHAQPKSPEFYGAVRQFLAETTFVDLIQ